jgi:hypothetical protein
MTVRQRKSYRPLPAPISESALHPKALVISHKFHTILFGVFALASTPKAEKNTTHHP